jgi:hypothetical protein
MQNDMEKVISNVENIIPELHLEIEQFIFKEEKISFDGFYEQLHQLLEAVDDHKEDTEKYTEHDEAEVNHTEVDENYTEVDKTEEHHPEVGKAKDDLIKVDEIVKETGINTEHEEDVKTQEKIDVNFTQNLISTITHYETL